MELKKFDPSLFPREFTDENSILLGRGSFGTVRVWNHPDGSKYALKILRITGGNLKNKFIGLENEAKILQQTMHPHIVTFHGVAILPDMEVLVMEFMEGGNFEDLIISNEVLPWTKRLRLLQELASAISYLHNLDRKKSVIHGDIKPQNILLTKSRVLKLSDFGSVAIRKRTGASTLAIDISPSNQHTCIYTAPELLKNIFADKTPAMDIYSFGVVVYEVLTRICAYSDCDASDQDLKNLIIHELRPNPSKLDEVEKQLKQEQKENHDIFLKLQSLMKKCWQQEPTKRPKATKSKQLKDYFYLKNQ
ncbi:uncharacterized protein LOC144747162 [Ciona intestinalis]